MCAKCVKKKKTLIVVIVAVMLIVLALLVICIWKPSKIQPETGEVDDGIIMSIHEQGEKTIVSTEYGKIMYPYSFSDLIQIVPKRSADAVFLEFYGRLEYGEHLLYRLWLGKEQGTYVGILKNRAGESVNVYLEMAPTPKNLQGWDENSFYAAQETINDVLSSFIPDYTME